MLNNKVFKTLQEQFVKLQRYINVFIVIDLCFHLRACENTKMKGTKEFVSSPTIREAAYFPSGLSFFPVPSPSKTFRRFRKKNSGF